MNVFDQQLQPATAFERLLAIMEDLREQCPWDKKQTMESLRHYDHMSNLRHYDQMSALEIASFHQSAICIQNFDSQ